MKRIKEPIANAMGFFARKTVIRKEIIQFLKL